MSQRAPKIPEGDQALLLQPFVGTSRAAWRRFGRVATVRGSESPPRLATSACSGPFSLACDVSRLTATFRGYARHSARNRHVSRRRAGFTLGAPRLPAARHVLARNAALSGETLRIASVSHAASRNATFGRQTWRAEPERRAPSLNAARRA